jgi:hypothetical protein
VLNAFSNSSCLVLETPKRVGEKVLQNNLPPVKATTPAKTPASG